MNKQHMIKHADSHLDHALTEAQIAHLMKLFADRNAFFIETIELPLELGTVPCGLYGPIMGDPPISMPINRLGDREALSWYEHRGTREWPSHVVDLPARPTRKVTVIAGPHEEKCPYCSGEGRVRGPSAGGQFGTCPKCNLGTRLLSCVLYSAFGGPSAPQEPGDPHCKDLEASTTFWQQHALAR